MADDDFEAKHPRGASRGVQMNKKTTTTEPIHIEQAAQVDPKKFASTIGDYVANMVIEGVNKKLAERGEPPLRKEKKSTP